jgi:hypothetical protein
MVREEAVTGCHDRTWTTAIASASPGLAGRTTAGIR